MKMSVSIMFPVKLLKIVIQLFFNTFWLLWWVFMCMIPHVVTLAVWSRPPPLSRSGLHSGKAQWTPGREGRLWRDRKPWLCASAVIFLITEPDLTQIMECTGSLSERQRRESGPLPTRGYVNPPHQPEFRTLMISPNPKWLLCHFRSAVPIPLQSSCPHFSSSSVTGSAIWC